jgi:hypothetical protein
MALEPHHLGSSVPTLRRFHLAESNLRLMSFGLWITNDMAAPATQTFMLGEFFDIWNQPLGPDQVGPARRKVVVFENGKQLVGNPRSNHFPQLEHRTVGSKSDGSTQKTLVSSETSVEILHLTLGQKSPKPVGHN